MILVLIGEGKVMTGKEVTPLNILAGFSSLDLQQKILSVKNYANTKFVNIVLEKRFYTKFEKIAEKLSTKPDIIINTMLLLKWKKWSA